MTKIKDLHRRWSRDDDYKAAYDGLKKEFRLGRALIEARTAAGLSQSQLARRMKTSQSLSRASRVAEYARQPMRWSASLKRPARAFGSSSNLRPLGEVRRATCEKSVMSMMLIAVIVVLLPPLQTGSTRTASAMQPDVDRFVRAAEKLAGTWPSQPAPVYASLRRSRSSARQSPIRRPSLVGATDDAATPCSRHAAEASDSTRGVARGRPPGYLYRFGHGCRVRRDVLADSRSQSAC
jgi:hypothetical protein